MNFRYPFAFFFGIGIHVEWLGVPSTFIGWASRQCRDPVDESELIDQSILDPTVSYFLFFLHSKTLPKREALSRP